jgi:hypothetical protein
VPVVCLRWVSGKLMRRRCGLHMLHVLRHDPATGVGLTCRARKQGRPASDFLRCFARSAHLAASHAGGLLEPLYALHSARLKLLDALPPQSSGGPAAGLLEAVARYRFLSPGGASMQPGSSQPGSPHADADTGSSAAAGEPAASDGAQQATTDSGVAEAQVVCRHFDDSICFAVLYHGMDYFQVLLSRPHYCKPHPANLVIDQPACVAAAADSRGAQGRIAGGLPRCAAVRDREEPPLPPSPLPPRKARPPR